MGKEEDIANVLIVDNDPEVARLMLEILARKGIRGHLVDDKDRALDFIDKGSCDLVFTGETIDPRPDRASRQEDGFGLPEKIRANWPELPVVMIADAVRAGSQGQRQIAATAVRAVQCGCCDFLIRPPKPARIEMLLDTFLPSHDVRLWLRLMRTRAVCTESWAGVRM